MVENNTGNGPFDGDGFCIAPAPMFLLYVPFPAHFVLLPLSSPLIPPAETDRCILRDMWTLAYERSYVQVSRNELSFACHTRIILFSSNREIRRMMSKSTQFYVLKKKLLLQIQFPTYQNFFRTFLIKRKFAGNVLCHYRLICQRTFNCILCKLFSHLPVRNAWHLCATNCRATLYIGSSVRV